MSEFTENTTSQTFEEYIVSRVEAAIIFKSVVRLKFRNQNEVSIFPYRVCFLDGVLCIIGEDASDKNLMFYEVGVMEDILATPDRYEPTFSVFEINQFINTFRFINDKEERLVIKIYENSDINLIPQHHHLHNPYVTMGSNGDMIWSATVEICDDLFFWLYSIKEHIEILDPGELRRRFASYCTFKERQKKVS